MTNKERKSRQEWSSVNTALYHAALSMLSDVVYGEDIDDISVGQRAILDCWYRTNWALRINRAAG